MNINKTFRNVAHKDNGSRDASREFIQFATNDTDSHLNIYLARDAVGFEEVICFNPEVGREIATYLAKVYGLITNVETRRVVLDADGAFVRFAEENE